MNTIINNKMSMIINSYDMLYEITYILKYNQLLLQCLPKHYSNYKEWQIYSNLKYNLSPKITRMIKNKKNSK